MQILANIVRLLHILFILFMLVIPFTNNNFLLNLYIIIVPFLFFHWATNDDTCFLTIVECNLRGVSKSNAFMQSLISPIYKVPNDLMGLITKMVTLFLFYFVLYKRKAFILY